MPRVERKGRARIGRTIRIALAVIACLHLHDSGLLDGL